jgi:YVTN family beta-propeller protein
VSVIDTSTQTVVATVPVGSNPTRVAITPGGELAYVTNSGDRSLTVIDTTTDIVTGTIPVGKIPSDVAAPNSDCYSGLCVNGMGDVGGPGVCR